MLSQHTLVVLCAKTQLRRGVDGFFRLWYSIDTLGMTPEILAKIMGIVAKKGERVIVIDPKSGTPFVLMGLDEYEKLGQESASPSKPAFNPTLTQNQGGGMIDPDLALSVERKKALIGGDWGGDEEKEEDRYYMEPAE